MHAADAHSHGDANDYQDDESLKVHHLGWGTGSMAGVKVAVRRRRGGGGKRQRWRRCCWVAESPYLSLARGVACGIVLGALCWREAGAKPCTRQQGDQLHEAAADPHGA